MDNEPIVNGRFLSQKMTGVQRFAYEITRELIRLYPSLKIAVPDTELMENEFQKHLVVVGKRTGTTWEQLDLYRYVKQKQCVLINLCNTAPYRYERNVVTIHDLGVYENKAWYSKKFVYWYKFLTPRIIKRALAIYTVSQYSEQQLHRFFPSSKGKTAVAYNGVSESLFQEERGEKEELFLHVGTISDRKNIGVVLDAFKQAKVGNHRLVLCGRVDENLNDSLPKDLPNGVELHTNASDDELTEFYRKAAYVICASHYEGFGMPILEGIAYGALPIISDILVFKELFDQESLFFNPQDSSELLKIMENVAANPVHLPNAATNHYLTKFNYKNSAWVIWESVLQIAI